MNAHSRRSLTGPVAGLLVPVALGLALAGCPAGEDAPEAEPTPAPKAAPPEVRTDLAGMAANTSLVPSPTEIQEAMMQAGVDIRFDALVQRRALDLKAEDRDLVALRTGIVLADLVLTLNHSEDADLLRDLESLRTGMKTIGAGQDVDVTLEQIIEHTKAGAVSRQELWLQVEEMREAAYGELAHEAGPRVVPLVQAGSWLEATDLLAQAILAAEDAGDAPNLLRQPEVVGYFLDKIKVGDDTSTAKSEMITMMRGTLEQIHDIAGQEALTGEDIERVHQLTHDLLVKM